MFRRRIPAGALLARLRTPGPARSFTSGGKRAAAPSSSSTSELPEEPVAIRRKLNLAHLTANLKDRDFALSAFFATHRPLVRGEDLRAAKQPSSTASAEQAQKNRIEIARYNDEYAKVFNTFTPYLPPAHYKLYTALDPAVLPSTHVRAPSASLLGSSSAKASSRSSAGASIADYLVYKSISKPLPSSLLAPASPAKAVGTAMTAPPAKRPAPSQEESDVLAAYFASANANCGMTLQQMMENSGPAYQHGQAVVESDRAAGSDAAVLAWTARPAESGGRVRKPRMYAISIMKRRRMKMKKHKWKKARKSVRDSSRYNRERRKKGGVQREKQE